LYKSNSKIFVSGKEAEKGKKQRMKENKRKIRESRKKETKE
jgi:hypothetical protein